MKRILLFLFSIVIIPNGIIAQTILGIDVSHYEGTINWTQVAAAGKVFAWAKATEGISYTDPTFTTNFNGGISAGVVMGAYHFARPETNTATAEANYFLSVASSTIATGNLPPALDLEDPPTGPGLTSAMTSVALTSWVQTWMTTVQNQTGITPVIYTSSSIAAYLNASLNIYGLWIAKPDGSATAPPTGLGVWNTWLFKQYSWTGTVSGISGSVDLDVFNGTTTQFNNLIGTIPCTAPSNDNCPGTPITSNGACLTGTVACATSSYGANQCTGCACTSADDYDVYYSFSASATSETVTLSNYAPNFDAVMELRTACQTGSFISCFDSTGIPPSVTHTWSNLTIGQTYYIRIFEYDYSASPPSSPTFDICLTHTACATPAQPGTISGNTTVCSATPQTYSISAVSGATSYNWSFTGGGTISGSGTSITFNPVSTGTLNVAAVNSCGTGSAQTMTISVNSAPAQPGTISGNASVCAGTSPTYSINAVSGATSYSWIYTGGGSPTGTGTSVTFIPTSSGTLSVAAVNGCGTGTARTLAITVNAIPNMPMAIAGNTSVCAGTNQAYSITAVAGATSYSWILPVGWSGSSSTISISATAGANSGTISVTADNTCGSSAQQTLSVNVALPPAQPGNILGNTTVCVGASEIYSVNPVPGAASYTWALPPGWLGTSTSPLINATVGNSGGMIFVTAGNNCGSSNAQTLPVSLNPALLINAGADQTIIAGDSANIGGSPAATGGTPPYTYLWSPPTGLDNPNVETPEAKPANTTTYTLVVTDASGCTSSDNVTVMVTQTTGLSNNDFVQQFSIFPNPNNGEFIVSVKSAFAKQVQLSCINTLGEIIFDKRFQLTGGELRTAINLSSAPTGVYLIRIFANGKTAFRKATIVR